MPAVIRIESGSGAGRTFPIEEDLFRVGAAATCKLQLTDDGWPAHAISVEYRPAQHGYLVHNRAGKAILLNGRTLAANTSAPWPTGHSVELDGVVLRLMIQGDPAPAKLKAGIDIAALGGDAPAADSAASSAVAPKKANQTLQIVVTVLCFAIIIALLLVKATQSEPAPEEDSQQEYDRIADDLREMQTRSSQAARILSLLQSARLNELRGLKNTAQRYYTDLVFLLKNMQQVAVEDGKTKVTYIGDDEKKVYPRTWAFVRKHVRQPTD